MLDPALLRARALEQVLFQESWRNERTINLFRGLIWCAVGVAMAGLDFAATGEVKATGLVHLGWGLLVLVFNFTWMKARFHRAVPWVLATMDVVVLVAGMQAGYALLVVHEPGMAEHHLDGVTVGLMVILGLNMMRFSWRLTLVNAACAIAAFTWVRLTNDRFDRLSYMDWLLMGSLSAMLVYTTLRFRGILEGVMIDLRRIQEERVASLGALVAGVAHELNTPLGALGSNTQLTERAAQILSEALAQDALRSVLDSQPRLRKLPPTLSSASAASRAAVDRIDHVVRSLRAFARLDEADVQSVDLHEGIESCLALLPATALLRIEVVRRLGALPPVSCRPSQLNQVWMHLINNAVQAMPEGGRLEVETEAGQGEVVVRVRDTGVGIPPERLARIFDPHFNRSGPRAKVGFGLSASYGIVSDHGGAITLTSAVGKGTCAEVRIPA
jgi:signal transduction histidine kinase